MKCHGRKRGTYPRIIIPPELLKEPTREERELEKKREAALEALARAAIAEERGADHTPTAHEVRQEFRRLDRETAAAAKGQEARIVELLREQNLIPASATARQQKAPAEGGGTMPRKREKGRPKGMGFTEAEMLAELDQLEREDERKWLDGSEARDARMRAERERRARAFGVTGGEPCDSAK